MTESTTTLPAIERRIELRASPERLWRALTEPDELAEWFGQRCSIDLRPGGGAWFEWDDGGRFLARVEVVDTPRRFAFRWAVEQGQAVDAGAATLVELTIEPGRGGGSVLYLRESGFPSQAKRFGNVHGWVDELGDLTAHLATEPWQAGIRRSYRLRSTPERVWQALSTIEGLDSWFGPTVDLAMVPGSEGWFDWPAHGRFAVRIEAIEPPSYLAWSWTPHRDVHLGEAGEVLRTEWLVRAAEDGGTRLELLETGFIGPEEWRSNSEGWDSDVLAALRRSLGESDDSTT